MALGLTPIKMDYGGFNVMPTGITHAIGAMPMITKVTRGVMRRNVDYTSCVISYLEVSKNPLFQLVPTVSICLYIMYRIHVMRFVYWLWCVIGVACFLLYGNSSVVVI